MQYALINNVRTTPTKGLTGVCICCGSEVIAKCGNIKIHHWAHKSNVECDSWWEPETEWHRAWKNLFPEEYREIPFTDPATGEVHRADVHTKSGITLEFQNSPISTSELKSREQFYQKLIWIVNGRRFANSFKIIKNIFNPTDPILNDFDFCGEVFFKKEDLSTYGTMGCVVYGVNSDKFKELKLSDKHFSFSWNYKHRVWFDSSAPVFIDFGDDRLYRLKKRPQVQEPFWYVTIVSKKDFIAKYSA